MGKMNLLKANYTGKVGQTVGAKWKDLSTIRTYATPADPDTADQRKVRGNFAMLTSFIALFADSIKYRSALDTSKMSLRNAIIKLNKALLDGNSIDFLDLQISKGGLQTPSFTSAAYASATGKVTFTVAAPTATNFTDLAKMICVYVNAESKVAGYGEAAADAGTCEVTVPSGLTGDGIAYVYFLDKRGSSKIASASVSKAVTA